MQSRRAATIRDARKKLRYKRSTQEGAVFAVDDAGRGCLAVGDDVCAAVNKLISELGTQRMSVTHDRLPEGDVYAANVRRFEGKSPP